MTIPKGSIAWLVAREHVSASPKAIERLIRSRTDKTWSESDTIKAVDYALVCHEENNSLFRHVNGKG
jgi:hypothetical protein